ncbi:hypothetical protein [Actinosynnema mirum]|uniref:Secreted protein n=1 Tax=Actinosynnema mirum (strain ATCC 29888 / DSM 43827 / JCM 3225 / NBRC 14064 / NCIMB 13271 / NRRL B-12336 / IMRU 3971 / 101) TaxID=446462 RepID=C6WDA4_ACTMD|nr:hypothetical protein [Actinosynnema mirum]ACU37723.1 hypothetical protein Amir_3844 [Actinosynnema mirum DSM 43827]
MKRIAATALGAAVLTALTAFGAPAAQAADHDIVVVFSTEFQNLRVYEIPETTKCYSLPLGAHVLSNLTTKNVAIYADPFCFTLSLSVAPNSGSHVTPIAGSFRV